MAPSDLVVGLGGLEPPASPLSGVRSNHLSYRPGNLHVPTNETLFDVTVEARFVETISREIKPGVLCGRLAAAKAAFLERR